MAKLYPISTAHNHDEVYAKIGEGGVTDHGALTGLEDNDHSQYRLASTIKLTSLAALGDNTATSFTPTNSQGALLMRTLGGDTYGLIMYDAVSTAYIIKIVGSANLEVRTGALTGTTGTDGKFTISAHTDGKIYFENRRGSTLYAGYIAI